MEPHEIASETLCSLSEAAKLFPSKKGGKRISLSTIYRYASRGIHGEKLEVLYVGGTTCTSKEAVLRFIIAVTLAKRQRNTPSQAVTIASTTRKVAAETALLQQLKNLGGPTRA